MTRLIVSVFIVMGLALGGGMQLPRMAGEVSFISEAEAAPPKRPKSPKNKKAQAPKKKPAFKQKPAGKAGKGKREKIQLRAGFKSFSSRAYITKSTKKILRLLVRSATWDGPRYYNNGKARTAMTHIIERHSHNSKAPNATRFAKGFSSPKKIKQLVSVALKLGEIRKNGQDGFVVKHTFLGKTIGHNKKGKPTSNIEVYIRRGEIRTAFPK